MTAFESERTRSKGISNSKRELTIEGAMRDTKDIVDSVNHIKIKKYFF